MVIDESVMEDEVRDWLPAQCPVTVVVGKSSRQSSPEDDDGIKMAAEHGSDDPAVTHPTGCRSFPVSSFWNKVEETLN